MCSVPPTSPTLKRAQRHWKIAPPVAIHRPPSQPRLYPHLSRRQACQPLFPVVSPRVHLRGFLRLHPRLSRRVARRLHCRLVSPQQHRLRSQQVNPPAHLRVNLQDRHRRCHQVCLLRFQFPVRRQVCRPAALQVLLPGRLESPRESLQVGLRRALLLCRLDSRRRILHFQ